MIGIYIPAKNDPIFFRAFFFIHGLVVKNTTNIRIGHGLLWIFLLLQKQPAKKLPNFVEAFSFL